MPQTPESRSKWLIAAWPGMGTVGVGAAGYLVDQLSARMVHELHVRNFFELQHVEVRKGLARVGRPPRSLFFEWSDPDSPHDLLIHIAEAQPKSGGYALCHQLLDYATSRGVDRLFTFAAMATPIDPTETPRVFGVCTEKKALSELREYEVELLEEGQIGGLNGVLLAAGAERKLPGVCLMGELPFYAASVPNPKASMAVLKVFSQMAGFNLDYTDIAQQADAVEEGLLQMLEKMKEAARQQADSDEEDFTVPEFAGDDEESEDDDKKKQPALDKTTQRRIESLFEQTIKDRSRAFQLKEELDRLGVFEQYEDRFLDLFKKAE